MDLLIKEKNQTTSYLKEFNANLESILKNLGIPKTLVLLMQEAMMIEFKEQCREMLIALCLRKLVSCKLNLQPLSSPSLGNSAVSISPVMGRVKPTLVGKGKGLKRKTPTQNQLLMNFLIWNARKGQ